jgi:membrane-associated protease RseP (regulator of RpoE activity)
MRTSVLPLLGALALVARSAAAQVVGPPSAPVAPVVACAPAGLLRAPRFGTLPGDSADGAAHRMIEMREIMAAAAGAARGAGQGMRISLSRGWLGLSTEEITERRIGPDGMRVRYCDYPVVVSVAGGSPAQRAGLEPGDTIVAYNDVDLRDGGELMWDRLFVPDSTVRVSVRREGRTLSLPLVVGRMPSDVSITQVFRSTNGNGYGYVLVNPEQGGQVVTVPRAPDAPSVRVRTGPARVRRSEGDQLAPSAMLSSTPLVFGLGFNGLSAIAGAQLVAMDDDLRQVVGAKSGVLVLRVAEGSPASEAGLRSGDVILTADGTACTTPMIVQRALLQNREGRAVPLKVERRGKTREVTLRW